MTSKEKLALIKETWYDVDLTDEKYIDFDEEQTFSDLEKDLERLEAIENAKPSEALSAFRSVELTLKENRFLNEGSFLIDNLTTIKQALLKAQEEEKENKKQKEILKILKDKEVDVNFFKTLIPFHQGEDLMMKYNETHWKGKLTLEETIKIKEWLNGK